MVAPLGHSRNRLHREREAEYRVESWLFLVGLWLDSKQLRGNETKLRLEQPSGVSAADAPGQLEDLLFYLESRVNMIISF